MTMIQTTHTARDASDQAGTVTPARGDVAAPQSTSPAATHAARHRSNNRDRRPRVSWYGALLILLMLTIAAGWELWRLLLLALTLD